MLPKEINAIFEEYSEDDYDLWVTKVDNSSDDFVFDFLLEVQNINDNGPITQEWSIIAVGHRVSKLTFGFESTLEIKEDHPLLWEYTDTQCQLYYSGHCNDIPKLYYDLYKTHIQLFRNYKHFDLSFGENISQYKPFQYDSGLLSQGSKKLMLQYADCLKKNGLDFTIIGERPATYWNGHEYLLQNKDLKILFFGDDYMIAKEFSFVQIMKNSR